MSFSSRLLNVGAKVGENATAYLGRKINGSIHPSDTFHGAETATWLNTVAPDLYSKLPLEKRLGAKIASDRQMLQKASEKLNLPVSTLKEQMDLAKELAYPSGAYASFRSHAVGGHLRRKSRKLRKRRKYSRKF